MSQRKAVTTIPGFWLDGPHEPLNVVATLNEFVHSNGGEIVSEIIPQPATFENADYLFRRCSVVAELKEIDTEFSRSSSFTKGYSSLLKRVCTEDPNWRPVLFGGDEKYPTWFHSEFVRLFRPPISRIFKKANRQLRATKSFFGIETSTGVLFLVNDGFTAIGPNLVQALASSLLVHSYSSIDCLVYLTVNRYVEIAGSDVPRLMWLPVYSDRAPDSLVPFVDDLGRSWFKFLETKIGPFTIPHDESPDRERLAGSRAILLPDEGL